MCALIGAPNKELFEKILEANRYRGEVSHSVARFLFDREGQARQVYLTQGQGPYVPERTRDIPAPDGYFSMFIGHTQAPTTNSSNIHPATHRDAKLWHNGIVKQKEYTGWDTQLILEKVYEKGFRALSDIDGSFACFLHMDDKLYVFRNEISPLFFDPVHTTFSSTLTDNTTQPIPANQVFAIEPGRYGVVLRYVAEFKTKENPYFF